jgi:hypothetical protein
VPQCEKLVLFGNPFSTRNDFLEKAIPRQNSSPTRGKKALLRQIQVGRQADVALSNGATDTVDILDRWHNVTHNESSYRDVMALAELAGSL